jgi:hypothetical protein
VFDVTRTTGAHGVAPQPVRAVRATQTSVLFHGLLPFDDWKAVGARMATHASASSWWLGDWLLFGRMKYGCRYKEAIAATGLDYQTLRNYAVVARRFPPARRRADVTFQHHAEVAALDDAAQDEWLSRAAAGGWSRNELRRRLRAAATIGRAHAEVVRLEITPTRAERWRAAAEQHDCDLVSWIVGILDDAAAALSAPLAGATSAPTEADRRAFVAADAPR